MHCSANSSNAVRRINNPTLSLTQLGDMLGIRKDAVSGRLRRTKDAILSEKELVWKLPQ